VDFRVGRSLSRNQETSLGIYDESVYVDTIEGNEHRLCARVEELTWFLTFILFRDSISKIIELGEHLQRYMSGSNTFPFKRCY
jgi:hypothetical protein